MTKCTLTENELIEESFKWVKRLADTGGSAWTLRVPVDFNNDPDILFCELGNRLKEKTEELSKEREKAKKLVEALEMCLEVHNTPKTIHFNSQQDQHKYNELIRTIKQSLTEYEKL